jgi:glycosyltransferase involved in cell wall biosynthesis
MKVSVALATFNGERFLEEQLASLARQNVGPAELVVCDDGSSDATVEIVERFAADAPFPVRMHANTERMGFADTFLRAASLCSFEAIAFCDQDDVWLESKLERCAAALAPPDLGLVVHTSRLVDENLHPTGRSFPNVRRDRVEPPLAGDPWLAVRGMSMVFAARLLHAVDPARRPRSHYRDARMHHDEWIYVLARALGSIAYVAEPLALYRQHSGNVTGADPGARRRLDEAVDTGWSYYSRRREQAVELAAAFEETASRREELSARAADAARWYRDQAARLERRLVVYEPEAAASRRLERLVRLAASGGYRRRRRGGFGARGFVRDAVMIALRRSG